MTLIIKSLSEISDSYDTILCDLWGCLHNGVEAFQPAMEALRSFKSRGKTIVLLTNAPRPSVSVQSQLDTLGVPRDIYDQIVSSGEATRAFYASKAQRTKVWHLGPDKDIGLFTNSDGTTATYLERVPITTADEILCTGLFNEFKETPSEYIDLLAFANTKGLSMTCANPDIVVDKGSQKLFCAGALASEYVKLGGKVKYFGKPHREVYEFVVRQIQSNGHSPGRILAIGDGPHTDILGASNFGIDSLFITSGIAAAECGSSETEIDGDQLTDWLSSQNLKPTFTMHHLI